MDEDLLVREIIKSLAFEIEAVNEDNVLRWTTINGTPLSVKVRVRNKDEPRLVQRGPIPVPRLGITAPERLRLVSSDQTILSFNFYLEDESTKQEEYKRRNIFKIFNIGGCLGTCSDDDGPYLPSSSNQKAIGSKSNSQSDSAILDDKVAQIYGATNTVAPRSGTKNGIFGKCKPGGCLDPPFGEDRYSYALSKTDRREKLALQIGELEDQQEADKQGGPVNLPFAKKKYLNVHSKEDQENVVSQHHEPEPKIQTDNTYTASDESRRKTQESSIEFRTSAQITNNEEDDTKKVMDIYARNSRENSVASKYSNSLITYHTDTSSSESLYESIPNKRSSVKSYNESQRQSYEYPESYFVPPKDFLRHKEEERRYSKEPSNYQIRASSNVKVNDISEIEEQKSIYQNAKGSKDMNIKKLKLTLTELQPNDIDVAQKNIEDKVKPTYWTPDIKESRSYILTESKIVDDVPNKINKLDFEDFIRQQEVEHLTLQEPKISQSGNYDVSIKEVNSDIAIKMCVTGKTDNNILRSGEINKYMKPLTSPFIASNNDVLSEMVKTNVQKLDETSNSYPYKEPSNYQNGPSKVNDMTDTNAIKAELVEHKPVSLNGRGSKDLNIKEIELLSELQPNDIEVLRKLNQDKVTPACLSPDTEEPASDIYTDYKNADDHINVPDKSTKGNFNRKFKGSISQQEVEHRKVQEPKISPCGNVDTANMDSDIEIKVWSTEKPNKNILRSGESSNHTKPLTSPLIDPNINVLSEIITPNGQILDEIQNSYPNTTEHNIEMQNNILPLLGTSDYTSKKALIPTTHKDEHSEKLILTESQLNVITVAGSPYQDIQNISYKAEQTLAKSDSYKSQKTDICTTQDRNRETTKNSNQSEILDSPHFNKKISGEIEDLDHKVYIRDKNMSGVPAQKFVVDQQKASKQDSEATEQFTQECDKFIISDVSSYEQNFEDNIDNNDDKTIQFGKLVVPDETVMVKKESLMTKNKSDIVNITKAEEKNPQNQEIIARNEESKRERKDLSPYSESNSENKEFDVSSIHSIDFTRDHEINDGVDTLGKRGNLNSVIIEKDFLGDSNIKSSPEALEKPTSAIFQKTMIIPKRESDINKDDINKTTPLKRNTFTIIASDTTLQKQEEIEEIPEEVTNILLKAIDSNKSVSPSQNHEKTETLDTTSKTQENKIHSDSGVEPIENTTQEIETKNISKMNDSTKPIVINQAQNKSESLDKSNKYRENKRNLIKNKTDVLDNMAENEIGGDIDSAQKTDGKSVSTPKSTDKIEIFNMKHQELEYKKYRDTHVESLPTNIPVNTPDLKLAADRNGIFSDQNHSKIASLGIDNIEIESKMYHDSGVNKIKLLSDTNKIESSETENTSNQEYNNKIHDVLSVNLLKKQIPDLYSKNSNNDSSEPSTQIRVKAVDLPSRTDNMPENKIGGDIDSAQKTDGKSVLTPKSTDKIEIFNMKHQELEYKKYRDTHVESLPTNIPVNMPDPKLAADRTGVFSDQNHCNIASFGTDNIEIENNMYNDSGVNKIKVLSDTNKIESSETENTSNQEYNNKMHDVLSVNLLQKQIPDLYSKNSNNDSSAPSTQIREKTVDLPSRTEGDKSPLTSVNHDNPGNINKTQENNMYVTASSQNIIPEYVEDLHSKIISDDELMAVSPSVNNTGLLATHDGSGLDSSERSVTENVRDFDTNIIDDGKLAQDIQDRDKAETLDIVNEVMKNKTPHGRVQNAATDRTQTLIPQNENYSHYEIMNHDKLVSVDPRSDEIELDINYKELIHQNLIDSISSENQVKLLSITDKKSELEDVKYKNLDNLMYNEPAVNSVQELLQDIHAKIVDDDKHVFAGQTETGNIDADSNQQQMKITRECLKQTDNIFSVAAFDKTSIDIPYVYNNDSQEQIEFNDNINPEINDKTKSISEKNSPFTGYSGLANEVLSNILENAEMEDKNLTQSKEPKSTIERGADLIKLNTEVKQDNSLDIKFSYIAKESVPILSATSAANIDLAPKLDDYSYKAPKNTLVDTSISTLKDKSDRDTISKASKETFEIVKHMNKPTNISCDDESFSKKSNVYEKHRAYQLSKLSDPIKYSIELDREDFDTISSAKIGGEKPSIDYRQPIISKQKDKSPPSHQIIKESRSQMQSGISYLDMSFYSYINNNNQRVVQTYSAPIEQRRNEPTVTVVKSVIRHGNEIRIPVDKDNDLILNIVDKQSKIYNKGSNIGSPSSYLHRETRGKQADGSPDGKRSRSPSPIDTCNTRGVTNDIDRAQKQDVLSKNLALIYESGLIPLHNVIKDLTEQVNILTTKQEIFQERKRSTKRTKSLRLIPVSKRCGCKRI